MPKSPITGYGDNLTVFGTRIGDLSPNDHEQIELDKGGFNYKPLEDVVVSHVQDSSTLICRKPSQNDVEEVIIEENTVNGKSEPIMVHSKNKNKTGKISAA